MSVRGYFDADKAIAALNLDIMRRLVRAGDRWTAHAIQKMGVPYKNPKVGRRAIRRAGKLIMRWEESRGAALRAKEKVLRNMAVKGIRGASALRTALRASVIVKARGLRAQAALGKAEGLLSRAGGSRPGDYPRRRTGHLRKLIDSELGEDGRGQFVRVGTNVPYGKYLELGTYKMRARPWMKLTNRETMAELRRILGGQL